MRSHSISSPNVDCEAIRPLSVYICMYLPIPMSFGAVAHPTAPAPSQTASKAVRTRIPFAKIAPVSDVASYCHFMSMRDS